MDITLASRHTASATLERKHPGAQIIDVTSRGPQPWVRFSPFFPHGGIPVPLSPQVAAASVEGIWQGLKVFAQADVDMATMANTSMRGIKRTARRYGAVLGHRAGVGGQRLLAYAEARRQIYLPAYRWVLDCRLQPEVAHLRTLAAQGPVVLLDYETNADIDNLARPLSHAALVIAYLRGAWPA
ncbi:hypothetical protein F8S13_25880 [Chloroflexia bacterium SDU3-3]|nr:hypothetical protein F8S13_25880 [Chloroflexia bacterium SDU3-3]